MALTAQKRTVLLSAPRFIVPDPIDPTKAVLAVDGSNWTEYDYTDEVLRAWQDAGVGLVLEQAINPPVGYPVGRTRQHVGACLNFGMPVSPYAFWWAGVGTDYLKRQLDLLSGFESRLVRSWLDVEDSSVGVRSGYSSLAVPHEHMRRLARQPRPERDFDRFMRLSRSMNGLQDDIASWLAVLDTLPVRNRTAGVYSGPWYSPAYVDLSPFANRPWWSSWFDNIPDVMVGPTWGGHSLPMTIKQYFGSTSLAGFGGIDLNIVSAAETVLL